MGKISKHFEKDIWAKVVLPVMNSALEKLDPEFVKYIDFNRKNIDLYKVKLGDLYEEKRDWLKQIYFGVNYDKKKLLDMHKIAAVVCRSILACKPFSFDTYLADKYKAINKKNNDFNWIIDNYLVNYKIAVNAALVLVFYDLIDKIDRSETLKEENKCDKIIRELINSGFSLYNKEPFLLKIEHENFYNSLILNLAINDVNKRKFDYLGFATNMFQLQQSETLRIEYLQTLKKIEELKEKNI